MPTPGPRSSTKSLPVVREGQESTPGPVRVLLVESESTDARILTASLNRAGFLVDTAISLADARRRLSSSCFDLVVAAELVPDGCGVDLLQDESHPPIVLLSDGLGEERIRRALSAGAVDVLVKDGGLLPLIDRRLRTILELQAEHTLVNELLRENEELARYNRILLELSVKDPLTGILNRRGFEEAIRREASRADRTHQDLALATFDLDNFKSINDHHGHQAGDVVLKMFGSLMRQEGRTADIVARVGGDEFAALLPSTTLNGALNYAERVRIRIERTAVPFGPEPLTTTVSVGAALFSEAIQSGRELLTIADDRLYRAKSEGRNRIVIN